MSEEIKNPETNEAEKPKEMDFTNFLTAEDEFRMEMEKYIPVFVERLTSNTLESDQDFINWTLELMDLGKAAGIDMQKYIMDYCHENGLAQ
ncbi:MAG: hypothetical protein J6U16_08305 [Ruminococcus sp.]|nr:hypothetical protein [Ruminococcus sp.]